MLKSSWAIDERKFTQSHHREVSDVVLLDTGAAHLDHGQLSNLKLAKDCYTVHIPQPSAYPNDSLI